MVGDSKISLLAEWIAWVGAPNHLPQTRLPPAIHRGQPPDDGMLKNTPFAGPSFPKNSASYPAAGPPFLGAMLLRRLGDVPTVQSNLKPSSPMSTSAPVPVTSGGRVSMETLHGNTSSHVVPGLVMASNPIAAKAVHAACSVLHARNNCSVESSRRSSQPSRTRLVGTPTISLCGEYILKLSEEINLLIYASIPDWREVILDLALEVLLPTLLTWEPRLPPYCLNLVTRDVIKLEMSLRHACPLSRTVVRWTLHVFGLVPTLPLLRSKRSLMLIMLFFWWAPLKTGNCSMLYMSPQMTETPPLGHLWTVVKLWLERMRMINRTTVHVQAWGIRRRISHLTMLQGKARILWRLAILATTWIIWRCRNRKVFENKDLNQAV